MKDINIVFLNYNCKKDILNAVESVLVDIKDCPYDVQVTVADNSRNFDGIKEELWAKFPGVKYLNTGGNVGFGKGNNAGFQATPARY